MKNESEFAKRFIAEYGFMPELFRQWAGLLERDYWGNLSLVIDEMEAQVEHLVKMRKGILMRIMTKQIHEYGCELDAEELQKLKREMIRERENESD